MKGEEAMKAYKIAGFAGPVPREMGVKMGVQLRVWRGGGKGVLDVLWMFGRFGVEI